MTPEQFEAAIEDVRRPLDKIAAVWSILRDDPATLRNLQIAYSFPLKGEPWTDFIRRSLKAAAGGDIDAEWMLTVVAEDAVLHNKPMSPELRPFAAAKIRGQTKRRPGPNKERFILTRDAHICAAIMLAAPYVDKPTRNDATRDAGKVESACSIVDEALSRIPGMALSERLVEDVWQAWVKRCREAGIDASQMFEMAKQRPTK